LIVCKLPEHQRHYRDIPIRLEECKIENAENLVCNQVKKSLRKFEADPLPYWTTNLFKPLQSSGRVISAPK
jgi:hypothetical protein